MDLRLAGARVLITGGGSGIGRACARAFVDEGAQVAVLDRNPGTDGPGLELLAADVRDESQVARAVGLTAERLGGIDTLVCCAGISGPFGQPVDEIDATAWDDVMAVNVRGVFLTVKHAVRHLRSSKSAAIVLLASDSSYVAAAGMVPYCTSKGALLMLTRALSVDLAEDGIRVNCVAPSIVDTPLARDDLGRPGGFAGAAFPVHAPDEVARHVLYLASPVSGGVNGASLVADHGYLARSAFPA